MMKLAADLTRNVFITMMYPTTEWEQVWVNLHAICVAEAIKINWFKVILPTNERQHAIRLVGSPLCPNCGEHVTVMHKNIECGEGRKI
jgi:hypothetical protein